MRHASVWLALVFVLAFPTLAGAASFDCAKAAQPDEIAICQSRTLSELDVAMATLYGVRMKVPMLMGARGDAGDEQTQWLQSRHACGGNLACLTGSYKSRISALNAEIDAAMHDYCVKLGICG
jgi:uncharacterized protein